MRRGQGEGRLVPAWEFLGTGLVRQLEKPSGHLRPFAFLLVLEKDEGILPVLLTHALHPRLQLYIAIVRPPQSQIAPIRRRYERNLKIVFRFGYAQRRPMIAQQAENLVVEPRLMAELECRRAVWRQQRKKLAQPWRVLPQKRWQLEQQRPQAVLQRPGDFE